MPEIALKDNVPSGYSEISQPVFFTINIMEKKKSKYEALTHAFRCTDFLVEAVIGSYVGHTKRIHGFTWRGDKPFYNKDVYVFVQTHDIDWVKIINDVERQVGIPPTKVISEWVEDERSKSLVRINKAWTINPVLIHAYFYIARCSQYFRGRIPETFLDMLDDMDNLEINADVSLVRSIGHHEVFNRILELLSKGDKIDIKYIEKDKLVTEDVYTQHNRSGIKTYMKCCNVEHNGESSPTYKPSLALALALQKG